MKRSGNWEDGLAMDRRSFLTGAAATGALAAVGSLIGCGSPKSSSTEAAAAETATATATWDAKPASVADQVASTEDHEVIIVGGGNSGIVCALEIAQLGGEVVVLERSGGSTMWAGDIDALDSQIQKDLGITLDKEFIIHDLVRYGSGKVDENLIRLWAYNSGAFVDWYQKNLQAKGADVMVDTVTKKFHPENSFYSPASCHTAFVPPLKPSANSMGSEVAMPAMLELLGEAGGVVKNFMTVVELIQDETGKVTGVIAQAEDKSYIQYNASKAVVLATGGFLGNKDMMDQLGVVSHKFCSNHIGGDGRVGDGIKLATWAGAERDSSFAGSMLIFDRGALLEGEDLGTQGGTSPSFWWPGSQPFLRVNSLGQRFCNEDGPYDFVFNLATMQPGHYWWQVFDSSCWDDIVSFGTTICSRLVAEEGAKNCLLLGKFYPCTSAEEFDSVYLQPNIEQGIVRKAETLDELADIMGVPKETFLATVDRYNTVSSSGVDTDHGKAPWRLSNLDTPPYYAAKLAGWALATLGGVHVNHDFNAISPEGHAIEGLYMAGLDVGGFFNGNYPEYYGGLCMGRAVTLSWLAAHAIMGEAYPIPVESARLAYEA
ncbi:MAG: FAD-binding protein [Actinobacteria bacterium]|nr:FAD-binding protein [Actinomycetota bacterium]